MLGLFTCSRETAVTHARSWAATVLASVWSRFVAAAAAGAVLYLASPPRSLWWLAPVSFTLLTIGLHGRSTRLGFGMGVVFGTAYMLPLLKWLYDFLGEAYGVLPWFGAVAVESLFFGLAGAGMARVSRLAGAPVWMAAVVVGAEALRSRVPFGGFPWGRVAFTQPEGVFLPLAAFGGASLVGFAVVLVGCGLGVVLLGLRGSVRSWAGSLLMAAFAVAAGASSFPLMKSGELPRTVTVAVIQGNAPDLGIGLMGKGSQIRANHVAEAQRLVGAVRAGRVPRPDLVVLPESSNSFGPSRDDPQLDRIVDELDVPLAAGGIASSGDGGVSNRMIRWIPGVGPTDEYAKQQLVPFSEFVPLRSIASAVTPFVENSPQDMTPGDEPGIFDMSAARVGFATCYLRLRAQGGCARWRAAARGADEQCLVRSYGADAPAAGDVESACGRTRPSRRRGLHQRRERSGPA